MKTKILKYYLFALFTIPHVLCFFCAKNKSVIIEDIKRWCTLVDTPWGKNDTGGAYQLSDL